MCICILFTFLAIMITNICNFSLLTQYFLFSLQTIDTKIIASSTAVQGSNIMTLAGDQEMTAAILLEIDLTHYYFYVARSGQNHFIEKVISVLYGLDKYQISLSIVLYHLLPVCCGE